MATSAQLNGSRIQHIGEGFNAEEFKRTMLLAQQRGLIRGPGGSVVIEKNGIEATALGGVRSQWIEITPAMATRWLTNNFRNRRVDDYTVMAYARDMACGQWVATHQGIAFNDKDELIDGQHRLMGIVKSGRTVRMMVTFGLPSRIDGKEMTTMDAVDRGRPRSVADQLTIQHGMKNGSVTASVSAALASLCCGERTRRLSVGQTLEVYREFESAAALVIAERSKQSGLRTVGVLAGFIFALMPECEGPERKEGVEPGEPQFWESRVAKMFRGVNTGEGLETGGAASRLREFLTSDEAKLFTRSLDRGLAELVLQAIWLELEEKRVKKLEPGAQGLEHFRALQKGRVDRIADLFRLPERERMKKAA
jgi:hypothetical protein